MRFPVAAILLSLLGNFSHATGESEPVVHMLVPGFSVQELPVKLSNVNNLRFAPDGRLSALGYDGRVHLLRDTDGDGLEDQGELFWDKPTLSVPVGMAWSKEGLYVSSHGKISLLRDLNGDGKADVGKIVTTNWPPTDVASGGVDATAITLDKKGNIYFGLLTADYSNPYRVKDGASRYDLNGKRGTIQKLSSDWEKIETIATGIRVPYTLAFNRHGDLFVTDQEGETWCPDGNPLDEINHIIPGRNYGFPPRHEKWLPDLVSEPPVVTFGPQHQSTCGMVFNEPHPKNSRSPGQGLFGPRWWEGDALVAGESRGKIWRVRLVKTPYGYIGKEYIIARLSMLTTDVAISPKGDLYVCCHSGLPDWGTGPQGEGKIFKISYTDPKAPQPVIAWAAGPNEVRVAFDKPLDPSVINRVVRQEIGFGKYVRAADRYEVLKPPYAVVKQQEATPRGKLKIVAAKLDNDGQTLVLSTAPHPQPVTYALTVPGVKAKGGKDRGATVDVDYGFDGATVLATRDKLGKKLPPLLKGWGRSIGLKLDEMEIAINRSQPYPDTTIARSLLDGASPLIKAIDEDDKRQISKYLVKGLLNLPAEASNLNALSHKSFDLTLREDIGKKPNMLTVPAGKRQDGLFEAVIPLATFPQFSQFQARFSDKQATVTLGYTLTGESVVHPLAPRHLLHTKAPMSRASSDTASLPSAFVTGDWEHGRELFFDLKLQCAKCHRIRGEGETAGPDLDTLASRDAAAVLRDIKEPNASINPDFVAYNVSWQDGDLTGFIRAQDESVMHIVGADGKERVVPRADIRELHVSSVSLMPTGLLEGAGEGEVRDLLTFLLHAPPVRKREEIQAALAPARTPSANDERQLDIVLVASKQDHGPGQHDYPAWQKKLHALLETAPRVQVSDAWEWPSAEQFQTANVIVFYFWNHDWSAERYRQLDDFLARGAGIVLLHSATIADTNPAQLATRIGLAAQPGPTKYLHTPFYLKIVAPTNHVITRNLPTLTGFLDEPYWPMIGDTNKVEVLATTEQEGKEWPMLWTFRNGSGRVFASILGHYTWTLDDPLFRILVLRGIAWAGGADPTQFEPLARPEPAAR